MATTTPARQAASSIPVPSTSSPFSPSSAVDSAVDSSPPTSSPGHHPRQHSSRFSKDLAEIRKFTAAASHDGDGGNQADELESNVDTEDYGPSGDEREDRNASQDDLNAAASTTLSKRADFILANAKRKLNLLEGNLGRARHSLLVSPQNMNELRTQSSLSSYAPTSPLDEEGGSVRIAPRFNFTPPRQARAGAQGSRRVSGGHTRMYSDTSVPPPGGQAIRGARSLDHITNSGDLQVHSPLREAPEDELEAEEEMGNEAMLDSVEEAEEADRRQSMNALRQLYGAGSPTPKSTQELRDQAEELRSRITFLRKRSAGDDGRNGNQAADAAAEQSERIFQTQVNALQKSLEDQERVIEELEAAERTAQEIENDPRGEWHQVLSRNEGRGSEDEFSEDEYFEYDDEYEEGEVPDALEDEDLDETKSMAGAHEDREDAFDYEHFILHSGMVFPHTRQASSSGSESGSQRSFNSQSTERGGEQGGDEEGEGREEGGDTDEEADWQQYQHHSSSSASLATTQTTQSFETAHEGDSSSDVGSEGSDIPNDILQTPLRSQWPMPPAANGERASTQGSDVPTPTASGFPREVVDGAEPHSSGRPVSSIVTSLLDREALEEPDLDLVRSTVESFRQVCLDLGEKETSTRDLKALRERLEVAKRVLNGEL